MKLLRNLIRTVACLGAVLQLSGCLPTTTAPHPAGTGEGYVGLTTFNKPIHTLSYSPQDGGVYVGGEFTASGNTPVPRFARLGPNGELDLGFNSSIGTGFDKTVRASVLGADGSIYVGGSFTRFNGEKVFPMVRLLSDGKLDASFRFLGNWWPSNILPDFSLYSIVESPSGNGDLYAAGDWTKTPAGDGDDHRRPIKSVVVLSSDGQGKNFFSFMGVNGDIYSFLPVSSSSGFILGAFTANFKKPAGRIAFVETMGLTIDTFHSGTGFDGTVHGAALIPDDASGRFYVVGDFSHYDGKPAPRIARLFPNGDLDAGFDPGVGFDVAPRSVSVVPNSSGDLFVSGPFLSYRKSPVSNQIVRLDDTGALKPNP